MTEILHVIPALSLGGAGRSLLSLCGYSSGSNLRDRIATLTASDGGAVKRAAKLGIEVVSAPDTDALGRLIEETDVVHVHYWNTPEMSEFLGSDLPPTRVLVWLKVHGSSPPQVLTSQLLSYADAVLATSDSTRGLAVWRDAESVAGFDGGVAAGIADLSRTIGCAKRTHRFFNVGYVGSVDFVKMHPGFLAMHDAVAVPDARFIVCGDGAAMPRLTKDLSEMDGAWRFDLRGYVEDIRSVLEELDVFGYPLTRDTYATSEKSLQEAMMVGVPPVVFPHAGLRDLVEHGVTGLVVDDENGYTRAIEHLHRHPDERARLGDNAARFARHAFDPRKSVAAIHRTYRRLCTRPRRRRAALAPAAACGSARFVHALGAQAGPFAVSYTAEEPQVLLRAEREIARASPVLCSPGAGGVFHYRRRYPEDAYLRLWSGLILLEQGRPALALAELSKAYALGLHHWRVSLYLAAAARSAGASIVELDATARLRREAPAEFRDLG
jgi:glycosyltransferase involved in cell wall biosynthesis